jgi:hypothetical protein
LGCCKRTFNLLLNKFSKEKIKDLKEKSEGNDDDASMYKLEYRTLKEQKNDLTSDESDHEDNENQVIKLTDHIMARFNTFIEWLNDTQFAHLLFKPDLQKLKRNWDAEQLDYKKESPGCLDSMCFFPFTKSQNKSGITKDAKTSSNGKKKVTHQKDNKTKIEKTLVYLSETEQMHCVACLQQCDESKASKHRCTTNRCTAVRGKNSDNQCGRPSLHRDYIDSKFCYGHYKMKQKYGTVKEASSVTTENASQKEIYKMLRGVRTFDPSKSK